MHGGWSCRRYRYGSSRVFYRDIKFVKRNKTKEGVCIAVEMINEAKQHAQGIYLMPAFNRFDFAAEIIETCKE